MTRHMLIVLTASLATLFGSPSYAHPGRLNAEGCHTNHTTGEYHCHRPPAQSTSPGIVKKSKSGICHAPSSPYYAQTKHFTPFKTLEACLASGGRLPKK